MVQIKSYCGASRGVPSSITPCAIDKHAESKSGYDGKQLLQLNRPLSVLKIGYKPNTRIGKTGKLELGKLLALSFRLNESAHIGGAF